MTPFSLATSASIEATGRNPPLGPSAWNCRHPFPGQPVATRHAVRTNEIAPSRRDRSLPNRIENVRADIVQLRHDRANAVADLQRTRLRHEIAQRIPELVDHEMVLHIGDQVAEPF